MRFLSVCSGIEAASVAWNPLGWKAAAFAEIEPFPCAVLAHHYPDVPNFGDMTKFKDWPDVAIDLLCGGTPCQSFSVAGLRKGLDDPRGNLMLTFGAIAAKYRPRWLVWENVPGVLSSDGGRDFGSFLGLLGILGYGFAYRVLDAQYAGLAQRRKRVFVVGRLGDWRSAAAVLFERHSLSGHPAPSRKTRQGIAGGVEFGPSGGGLTDLNPTLDARAKDGPIRNQLAGAAPIAFSAKDHGADASDDLSPTLRAGGHAGSHANAGVMPAVAYSFKSGQSEAAGGTFVTEEFAPTLQAINNGSTAVPSVAFSITPSNSNKDYNAREVDKAQAVTTGGNRASSRGGDLIVQPYTLAIRGRGDSHDLEMRQDGTANALLTPNGGRGGIGVGAVAFHENQRAEVTTNETAGSLTTQGGKPGQGYPAVMQAMQVRRLTPKECARLQGFPDNYLDITFRGKPAADGPKYKALGNSWAVPCIRWIGERIEQVDAIRAERLAA